MGAASIAVAGKANSLTATSCGRIRKFLRFGPRVMQTARGLSPLKTAHYLSQATGYPLRTCEYWLSKETLPAEALGALLASEHGLQYLDAIAGQSVWWRAARRALAAAEEQEHKLQEAINAVQALAPASPTFRFQDVARGADRTVARSPKTRRAERP